MAANIKVNTQRMNKDTSSLRERLAQTKRHAEQLKSQMDALNASWQGPAHDVYVQNVTTDYKTIQSLCSTLQELIDQLERIRKKYDTCEASVQQQVDAINLNG